ncbi:MAG: serine O-acetyltransferase EpsC [Bacteroidota bacterium]
MDNLKLGAFASELLKIRKSHIRISPIKNETHNFINDLLQLLFPHFTEHIYYSPVEIGSKLHLLRRNLKNILLALNIEEAKADGVATSFINKIPDVNKKLWLDAEAIFKGDPAAQSIDEVIFAYPGFLAIATYRLAHELFVLQVPILPRIMTEYAHQNTGVDIHPGAEIGKSFCIDHGTGIVIGETTLIGNNVKIYQGVTLGALSVDKKLAKKNRHPTIEDNVVIYSQAVILGGDTIIGHDSVIGGNTWITQSVPPNSVVYHTSEIKVRQNGNHKEPIDFVI